jgi:hypothetical protein
MILLFSDDSVIHAIEAVMKSVHVTGVRFSRDLMVSGLCGFRWNACGFSMQKKSPMVLHI